MNLSFAKGYVKLQALLSSLGGEWDETQPNKKVYRRGNSLLNWFETTGTISFQGREAEKMQPEQDVRAILSSASISESELTVFVQGLGRRTANFSPAEPLTAA